MIQAIIFIILGASFALLIVFLLAPIFWNRAIYLAKQQLENYHPFSLAEVQAEYDALRAKHAVELYKINKRYKNLNKKTMLQQISLNHNQEQLHQFNNLKTQYALLEKDYHKIKSYLINDENYIADLIKGTVADEAIINKALTEIIQQKREILSLKEQNIFFKIKNISQMKAKAQKNAPNSYILTSCLTDVTSVKNEISDYAAEIIAEYLTNDLQNKKIIETFVDNYSQTKTETPSLADKISRRLIK
ncbi:hypothetical protein [Bartonella sp. DGB1]|uniref:hypothetical protein n=1 Tax=Bartonella sp. DGB1 TaxID=3239807 RepID=UPI003525C200